MVIIYGRIILQQMFKQQNGYYIIIPSPDPVYYGEIGHLLELWFGAREYAENKGDNNGREARRTEKRRRGN
jgi:hypothetical protein